VETKGAEATHVATKIEDKKTTEYGLSAPHQEASNDVPTPVDEDKNEKDDLLGEDLVDYGTSPEHLGIEVNVITFSTDYTVISDDEPAIPQFDFSPKEVVFTKPKESAM
jgi:hypothetical protein